MAQSHSPARIWVHAPASLHRIINGLPNQTSHRQALASQLTTAKKQGVDGIIVPISWRTIAPFHPANVEDKARWQGYLTLFKLIKKAGLEIVPEFNFGATGVLEAGTPHLLPDWFWGRFSGDAASTWPQDSLKYVDAYGNDSVSAPSLWATDLFYPYIQQWLTAFFKFADKYVDSIPQLLFGAGPNGELRYPLIDAVIDRKVCYQLGVFGTLAEQAFGEGITKKYGSTEAWQNAWQQGELTHREALELAQRQLDDYFSEETEDLPANEELPLPLADFYDWYQSQLVDFSAELLSRLNDTCPSHWQCQLGLRLPLALNQQHKQDHKQQMAFTGLSLHRDNSIHLPLFERLEQHLSPEVKQRLSLWLSGIEQTLEHQEIQSWLGRANELGLSLFVENRHPDALDDHLVWDKLMQKTLQHAGLAGWVLRDLDSALDTEQAGAARLRQLGRVKHGQGQIGQSLSRKIFRVMGPLHLKVANQKMMLEEENWTEFEQEIRQLRKVGVSAVSTDLWWGLIEGRQPGRFDWSYYDKVVEILAANEMHWVPILSFHQAGGNVNDDFMQTIPLWLWGKLIEKHDELESVRDLQYVSETGDASMEYVSLWADEFVLPFYRQFMEAFRDHYQHRAHMIDEINVSMGPAGELRYPSYNAHDWGDYPNRGTLQCFSRLAKKRWVEHLKSKFRSVKALNYAFSSNHKSFETAGMPDPDELFANKQYLYSSWGREFLTWYQEELIAHGNRILACSAEVFSGGGMEKVTLGVKVPGIHWEISDPAMPRAAEITAGLVAPHPELGPRNRGEYVKLIGELIPSELRERVALHFTCLEMVNKDYEGYSRAEDLVNWVADAAAELGVELMGENALGGELYGKQGWQQIARALNRQPGFGGITLLRMQNLFDDHPTPMKELVKLINQAQ
ncbi:family 14 glycosylhydrolase [Corallincola platygyrae]|uniref:Beta-amylase n=1 Tax=Corallincola platygyrae TaxID=1193278 RepID=A0ABW4XLG8_9GAMM